MKNIKLILTDIDGVWTDGGMYYGENNNELKKFNTRDSAGIIFARHLKIPVGIITGENTKIVENRAKKLNIKILHQGIIDKLSVAERICKEMKISIKNVAYIGDDIGDFSLLGKVGLSCCPKDSPEYIQNICHIVTKKKGGEGAFREFVEIVIGKEKLLDIINKI